MSFGRMRPMSWKQHNSWVAAIRRRDEEQRTKADHTEVDDRPRCTSCGEPTMYPNFRGHCRDCAQELYGDNCGSRG